jgi:hypothetical protein
MKLQYIKHWDKQQLYIYLLRVSPIDTKAVAEFTIEVSKYLLLSFKSVKQD